MIRRREARTFCDDHSVRRPTPGRETRHGPDHLSGRRPLLARLRALSRGPCGLAASRRRAAGRLGRELAAGGQARGLFK
jgi:hypothetical protein